MNHIIYSIIKIGTDSRVVLKSIMRFMGKSQSQNVIHGLLCCISLFIKTTLTNGNHLFENMLIGTIYVNVAFVSSNFKELDAILYKNNLKRMVRLFIKYILLI